MSARNSKAKKKKAKIEKKCDAKDKPQITGYQAKTKRDNGGSKTKLSDGAGKNARAMKIKIKVVWKQNEAFKNPETVPSSQNACSKKSAKDKQ